MDEQLRLSDLIPRRLTTFGLLLLAGLSIIAGLEALYAYMPQLGRYTTDGRVAAFDLSAEGSLGACLSSFLLSLASFAAVVVYLIRRHRADDYQGRYRIWLWAAMCWLLMAVDESASLHEGFKEMMALVTGTRIFGDGSIWWMIPYFFLLGGVGLRLLVDMKECRLSSATFVAVAVAYVLSQLAHINLILPDGGARQVMFEEGGEMVGDLLLLLAMGLHARYVILDAEGLLPRRKAKPADQPEDESQEQALEDQSQHEDLRQQPASTESRWTKSDAPHGVPQPAWQRTAAAYSPQPASLAGYPASSPPVKRRLTKADRKALRKRLEQMRRQREGRMGRR